MTLDPKQIRLTGGNFLDSGSNHTQGQWKLFYFDECSRFKKISAHVIHAVQNQLIGVLFPNLKTCFVMIFTVINLGK
jgi:hypothetical protein